MKLTNYTFILLLFVTVFSAFPGNAQYISRFAGNGTGIPGYAGDGGQANAAQLNSCTGVTVDGAGNIYIADRGNHVVRKINTAGVISTFAGTGVAGYSGNGGAAVLAQLNMPSALATDAAGNVYIAENGNHTVRVVSTFGAIRTYAGTGAPGYSGNGDTAHLAALNNPQGLVVDAAGNLYIADAGNNTVRVVSAASHIIGNAAGNGAAGYSGNGGPAVSANLNGPAGLAMDVYGNLYIADQLNNAIRKVSTTGVIATVAGTGVGGNTGDGGPAAAAMLRLPSSITIDGAGNMYIADQGNSNIRMVNTSMIISHVSGVSTTGYGGDGGPAASAKLGGPKCVYADGWGRLYVADYNNHVIRLIGASTSTCIVAPNGAIRIFPNPSNGTFTLSMPSSTDNATIAIMDMTGRVVATKNLTSVSENQQLEFNTLPQGNYVLRVITSGDTYTGKLTIGQ